MVEDAVVDVCMTSIESEVHLDASVVKLCTIASNKTDVSMLDAAVEWCVVSEVESGMLATATLGAVCIGAIEASCVSRECTVLICACKAENFVLR